MNPGDSKDTRIYSRNKVTDLPSTILDKKDRGRALAHLLDTNRYTARDFAAATGISYSTITSYLQGKVDLAGMHRKTAEKFIPALGMTDAEARAFFNVPPERWTEFSSGQMQEEDARESVSLVRLVLKSELRGTPLGRGDVVRYDPTVKDEGLLLVRLEDDSYLALDAMAAKGVGMILGELVSLNLTRRRSRLPN